MEDGIRNILNIESAEFVYRDVIYQGKQDTFLGLIKTGDTRLLFSVNFKVRAGVDIKKGIEISRIDGLSNEQEPAVLVKLHPAEILSIDADETSIRELFAYEDPGLEGRHPLAPERKHIKWLDVQDEVAKAKDRIRSDAVSRGIDAKAWKNASTLISNFLSLAGFKTVRIEASAGNADDPAPTAEAK